jgi:hypothetical protein
MQIRTISVSVSASRDTVFNFLANIENLPKWATEFCERLELRRGRWWAYTSRGEMLVELSAHDGTGVIDLCAGPAPDRLGLLPIRVLPLPGGGSLVSVTLVQAAGFSDESFDVLYQGLLAELRGFLRRFGGGEVHVPDASPSWAELGRN